MRVLRGAPWHRVLPVLLQVANILEHAHSRGVVHRDIKPGNVLFGADGRVLVTDFGTAARTGSTLALADGSPFSASPQQLAGKAATTADDIYGLGALAYELLSRYPPHYPDFDARRVQVEMPSPLNAVHPAPAQLLAFIMSMLEREPGARPSDMHEVIRALQACLPDSRMIEEAAAPVAGARHARLAEHRGAGSCPGRASMADGRAVGAVLVLRLRGVRPLMDDPAPVPIPVTMVPATT